MPTRIRLTEAQLKMIIERVVEGEKLEESRFEDLDESAMTDPEIPGAPICQDQ